MDGRLLKSAGDELAQKSTHTHSCTAAIRNLAMPRGDSDTLSLQPVALCSHNSNTLSGVIFCGSVSKRTICPKLSPFSGVITVVMEDPVAYVTTLQCRRFVGKERIRRAERLKRHGSRTLKHEGQEGKSKSKLMLLWLIHNKYICVYIYINILIRVQGHAYNSLVEDEAEESGDNTTLYRCTLNCPSKLCADSPV